MFISPLWLAMSHMGEVRSQEWCIYDAGGHSARQEELGLAWVEIQHEGFAKLLYGSVDQVAQQSGFAQTTAPTQYKPGWREREMFFFFNLKQNSLLQYHGYFL